MKSFIKNLVDRFVLRTYVPFSLYSKANVHNLEPDIVTVPRTIAEKSWTLCEEFEAEVFVVKRNGKFKFVKEIKDDDIVIYPLRRPRDGDTVIVIRHPVKNQNCVLSARLKIVDKDEVVFRVHNALIEKIEGDFDGDQILLLLVDQSIQEPIDEYKYSEKEFELPDFEDVKKRLDEDNIELDPRLVSKVLKFESPINFIDFVVKTFLGEQIDLEEYRVLWRTGNFGKFLDALEKLDNTVKQFVRLYFRSQGPKFAGYVQKVMIDAADVLMHIVDDKDFVEWLRDAEFLKLIDRLQQRVIDLKHEHNSLTEIDRAKRLSDLIMRKPSFEEIKQVVSEYLDDKRDIEYTSVLLFFATNRKDMLVWSYGVSRKIVDGTLEKSEIADDIRRLIR